MREPNRQSPTDTSAWAWWSGLFALTTAGMALALANIGQKWLWFDELLSANFAHGPWYSVLTEPLRFDPHPPLYYLQLHAWMALGGTSDFWLMLNPLAWNALATAGTAWVARRLYGGAAAWFAAALYLVAAGSVYAATQVRMYSMLPALAIWGFWLHRLAARGESGRRTRAGAVAFDAAIAYSHGIGLLLLTGLWAYGAWESRRSGHLRSWLRWRLVSLAVLSPCVVFALLRRGWAQHPVRPDLLDIGRGLRWLVLNPHSENAAHPADNAWVYAAAAVWLAWGWLALRDRTSRAVALLCVACPIAVSAAASYLIAPVWVPRNFTLVLPFFCIAAAGGAWTTGGRPARLTACALLAALAAGSIPEQFRAPKGDGFRPAAILARSITEPGDLLVFHGIFLDWFCFSWYHRGPNWGDPLAEQIAGAGIANLAERINPGLATRYFLHHEVTLWPAGQGANITTEPYAPQAGATARRIVRIVMMRHYSGLNPALPPLPGRSLVRTESLQRHRIRIEVWQ